jgi:hypothetical protein
MSRSDKFEDQYEGTFSEPTYEEIRKLSIDNPDFLKFYKTHREQVAISSWHINEYESFAMWQIFTQKRGLAIQSTIGRLQNALAPENNYKQFIGEVNYDYKRIHPFDDMFSRFYSREKAFNTSVKYALYQMWLKVMLNDGLKINVDIDQLIQTIYIHEIRKLV